MKTMNPFVKLGLAGFLIASSAVAIWSSHFPLQASRILHRPLHPEADTLSLKTLVQTKTAGPYLFREANLEIKFPISMLENETRLIEISYAVSTRAIYVGPLFENKNAYRALSTDPSPTLWTLERLDRKVRFELTSSGFSIEPSEKIERDTDSMLPIHEAWTITPGGAGNRTLLFRLHEEPPKNTDPMFSTPTVTAVTLNENKNLAPDKGYYPLPISVKTFWGLSSRVVSIIGGVITLVGFVLSWSVLEGFFKHRLRVEK